jgi:flagellar FliJ protein
MATADTMTQLIELAQTACDEAARRFVETQRQLQEAEAKGRLLADYWAEYQTRQRSIYRADATTLANFHDFVGKLKSTMDRHDEDTKTINARLLQARSEWEQALRKLKSFQKLASRRAQEQTLRTHRLQQKLQDEFVMQRGFRGAPLAG